MVQGNYIPACSKCDLILALLVNIENGTESRKTNNEAEHSGPFHLSIVLRQYLLL